MLALLLVAGVSFSPYKLAVDGRVIWAEAADTNGDGAADIVVAYRRGHEVESKRYIAWFYQTNDGGFAERPSEERAVPADAAFADLTDCDGDGKAEVLLMSAGSVSTYGSALAQTPTELIKVATAAPFPEYEDLPLWHFCSDWHKRGKNDIAVWQVGVLALYRNDTGKWTQRETVQLPPQAWLDSASSGFFRGAASNRDLSIALTYLYPKLLLGDYEADGKIDLFAVQEDRVRIFSGKDDGRFTDTPTVALDFDVRSNDERKQKNAYVSGQAVDLDGDKRTDFVINKVTGGLSSMHSETVVHFNHGGFKRTADQTIKRNGFSAIVQFADLNGDGKPEMIEPYGEVGLVTLARAMVSKKLSVDWLITPNRGDKLDTDTSQRFSLSFGLEFSGGPIFKGPFPRVAFDFDGDGILDLITSPDGSHAEIYSGRKDGTFEPDPSLKVNVECSPFTTGFTDTRSKRANILTFFRDMPGKESRIAVAMAR